MNIDSYYLSSSSKSSRLPNEGFQASIARHEYYLSARLGLTPEHHVLDCGCGIGGPLRNIGRFSGARITGVTLNQWWNRFQVALDRARGLLEVDQRIGARYIVRLVDVLRVDRDSTV
jgi:SAM-dependent methyltransferase